MASHVIGIDGSAGRDGKSLVRADQLSIHFGRRGVARHDDENAIRAVDNIDLEIRRGESVGLVGESGSGKSTTGRALIGLIPPTSGRVLYDGADLSAISRSDLRRLRRRMQIVFQDPYASLNPRMKVRSILSEALKVHGDDHTTDELIQDRVQQLLEVVGLEPKHSSRYPHEFSGGQRQRIAIARTLAVKPEFLVCDEPISALDVSIQAQILNLFMDLRRQLNLTYLFIAHDLAVVRVVCERVYVMYLGAIVESGPTIEVFGNPSHPYTAALLSAAPIPDPKRERARRKVLLRSDVDTAPVGETRGCPVKHRCWLYDSLDRPKVCEEVRPPLRPVSGQTFAACHFAEDLAKASVNSDQVNSTELRA